MMRSEGLKERHILLVEDDYFIVNDFVRQLTAAGAKIVGLSRISTMLAN